ncbi:MAG: FAD-dependent oxidoreductase [Anaerolineales bacterium]|jgi:sarcosine oxidase subunit beta
MIPRTAEVVIIGGGVMGASTAYHLALRGQKNILLLEKDEFFGQEATGRCAGGVRYQFSTEINVRLSLKSLPMLERFKDEIGQEINFRRCGYLFVLTQPEDVKTFRHSLELQQGLGVHTEWLTPDEIHQRLPLMRFEDALAGSFNPEDGLVDPNCVVMGYVGAAQRLGVQCLNNVEVTGIQITAGRIAGLDTNQGTISTPVIVNAAGPWAGVVGQMVQVVVPIEPYRRQIMTTSPLPEVPQDFPFVLDFAQSLYFHREGEGILTGMSNQNEKVGFDQTVDEDFELVNLEAAIARMPCLEKAGLLSHWAGLYEVTPDAHPIYGKTPVDGFYIVAGFSGHGFMHGPISGKLMAECILEGKFLSLDVSMLDLARFSEGRQIREYNVV